MIHLGHFKETLETFEAEKISVKNCFLSTTKPRTVGQKRYQKSSLKAKYYPCRLYKSKRYKGSDSVLDKKLTNSDN